MIINLYQYAKLIIVNFKLITSVFMNGIYAKNTVLFVMRPGEDLLLKNLVVTYVYNILSIKSIKKYKIIEYLIYLKIVI